MRSTLPILLLALAAAPAVAQSKSLLFTGRFPFKSLDDVNERPGGTINQLEEYDFSYATPGPGAFARSLQSAIAHQAYLGDGNLDGNFTKFYQLKTYFQNFQIGSVFVKHADKANVTQDKVFFTVRSNAAPLQLEAFVNNATSVAVIQPGDFVRLHPNGNLEYFMTQAQFDVAIGTQTGTFARGASALCQDAALNLYYSPATGGHHVNGNLVGTPTFAFDGAICMIDASNIVYDGLGNVASVAPNSARKLFDETTGALPVRTMVQNSLAYDRTGLVLVNPASFGKISGLDIDPNGGTIVPSFADPAGLFPPVPNMVFVSDAGGYGGTVFSTAANGSVAVINGVTCGSLTAGVAADGAWLGVHIDIANFQPSLMGLQVIDAITFEPTVLDTTNFGAILPPATQPTIEIDCHGVPSGVLFVKADLQFTAVPVSVPSVFIGLPLAPGSFRDAFPITATMDVGQTITDAFGYATITVPNPNTGFLTGVPVLVQAALLHPATSLYSISNPMMMQFK